MSRKTLVKTLLRLARLLETRSRRENEKILGESQDEPNISMRFANPNKTNSPAPNAGICRPTARRMSPS